MGQYIGNIRSGCLGLCRIAMDLFDVGQHISLLIKFLAAAWHETCVGLVLGVHALVREHFVLAPEDHHAGELL